MAELAEPGSVRLSMLSASEPRRYEAKGAYYPSDGREEGNPFEWHGRLQRDDGIFMLEGSYRHNMGSSEHAFYLELSMAHAASGRFYLHCPHLNDGAVSCRSVGAGVCFDGRAAGRGTAVSLSVEELPSGMLEDRGALVFASGRT